MFRVYRVSLSGFRVCRVSLGGFRVYRVSLRVFGFIGFLERGFRVYRVCLGGLRVQGFFNSCCEGFIKGHLEGSGFRYGFERESLGLGVAGP